MQQYKTENGICEDMYIIMDEESKTFKAKLTDECAKLHFKRKYAGMSPEKIKELQRMEAESNVSFFSTIRNTLFEITDSANVGCRYCSWSTLHSKNMRIISKCCNCGATGTKIRKSSGSYYWYECSECGSTDFQSLCPKCGMPL